MALLHGRFPDPSKAFWRRSIGTAKKTPPRGGVKSFDPVGFPDLSAQQEGGADVRRAFAHVCVTGFSRICSRGECPCPC